MDNPEFIFVLELLTTGLEKALIAALIKDPSDRLTRSAYMDYLKENGRDKTAELINSNWIPGVGFRSSSSQTQVGPSSPTRAIVSGLIEDVHITSGYGSYRRIGYSG